MYDIEQGLAGVNAGDAQKAGLNARRQAYLSRVNKDEIEGLVPTRRSLFAERYTASGTLAVSTVYKFGDKGVGDTEGSLGWSSLANGVLSLNQTNFLQDGTIPQGELFVVHGVSFEFEDTVAIADLVEFGRSEVRWVEQQGTEVLVLGTVSEMPRVFGVNLEFGYGADDETAVVRNPRFVGPPYMHKEPLFIIRGLASRSDQGHLQVTVTKAFSLSANTKWRARFHGVWFQRVGRK